MLSIKRSVGGTYWHLMYNSVMLECCPTRRKAKQMLEVYSKKLGALQ